MEIDFFRNESEGSKLRQKGYREKDLRQTRRNCKTKRKLPKIYRWQHKRRPVWPNIEITKPQPLEQNPTKDLMSLMYDKCHKFLSFSCTPILFFKVLELSVKSPDQTAGELKEIMLKVTQIF